ncbi:MAG TPA: Holliday junction branch migration protein RuvA, partial [Gammaproteobacteria bacterium]|nr:Holliday junction branch migration protein RuvA [Gammaproteobacteria bacterium]
HMDVLTGDSPKQDALNALVALGYKNSEAARAVKQIESEELSSEELIRAALRQMAS